MSDILYGTPGPDELTATGAALIQGFGGADTLTGSAEADIVYGDAGDDSISGGDGDDLLVGGDGNDTFDTGTGDDVVLGDAGDDTIGGMAGRDSVFGSDGNDVIAWNDPAGDFADGGAGNDTIRGGDVAQDTIRGGAGDDLLRAFNTSPGAATAPDIIQGRSGNDAVQGGAAADTLEGGAGDDTLSGEGGADVFVIAETPSGDDTITDFDTTADILRLLGFDAAFDPLEHVTDGSQGAVLDLGEGSSVLFLGRLAREFDATDFLMADDDYRDDAGRGNADVLDAILDPGSTIEGKTITEWTKEWWIWTMALPGDANPFFDETGAFAHVNNDGPVFFLAGTISHVDPNQPDPTPGFAERDITVEAGVPILLPIVNIALSEPETPALELAAALDTFLSPVDVLFASIDGVSLPDPFRYFEQTDFFSLGVLQAGSLGDVLPAFRLPPDFVDPVPAGTELAPAMAGGWWLMLDGLDPGEHTLRFGGGIGTPFTEVIVHLHLVDDGRNDKSASAGADYAFI